MSRSGTASRAAAPPQADENDLEGYRLSAASTSDAEEERQRIYSSALGYVPAAGSQEVNHVVSSIRETSLATYWCTRREKETVVLQLSQKALVSYLQLTNRDASRILTICIALRDVKRSYVRVKADVRLPHNKPVAIPIGHLPCRFIKIVFAAGAPISLYSVTVRGIPVSWLEGHHSYLKRLVYDTPEELLFGASLQMALEPAVYVPRICSASTMGSTRESPDVSRLQDKSDLRGEEGSNQRSSFV